MGFQRRIGCITEVRRSREELCLEWRIYDFLDLSDEDGFGFYESYRFSFSDVCWYFRVFPNYVSQGWVYIALHRDDYAYTPKTLICAFGLKGPNGIEKRKERERLFRLSYDSRDEKQFCKRSELSEQKHRLMPNNNLTFTCEMKVPGTNARDSSAQTDDLEVEILSHIKELKPGGEKALQDFGELLASGDWSDVTVQVGAAEFRVHSFVLFARCPALSVSLRHESREKASSRIVVEDCEPEIFRHFLHHLYTGSVQSLNERIVFSLYCIADRYLIDDLKQHCLQHVQDMLSIETFCDSMRLALTHGERGLLQRTIDFAVRNIRLIVCSVAWQDFIREYPTEANEIFIKSLSAPCNSQKEEE